MHFQGLGKLMYCIIPTVQFIKKINFLNHINISKNNFLMMASFIASTIAKKAYEIAAHDRNVLIPLDDIKNTAVLSDKQV